MRNKILSVAYTVNERISRPRKPLLRLGKKGKTTPRFSAVLFFCVEKCSSLWYAVKDDKEEVERMAKHKRRRKVTHAQVKAALIGIAVFFVGLIALIVILVTPKKAENPDTTVTAETTVTTTVATTVVTNATTTTAGATQTTAKATTVAVQTDGSCWLDDKGLLQFKTDGYYVQPKGGAWNLLLVNDWNGMSANYESTVTFVSAGNRGQKVDSRILADLQAMLTAGKAYGIDVQSGYRSAEHQGKLYWRQVQTRRNAGMSELAAQKAAGQVVKRPGYSEHNTGLAVDLGGSGNFALDQSFENTAAFKWLIANCADYGFILRFPKGKEAITGVIYEAWHFRYVGKEAAKEIMSNNLCLEEYLEKYKK